jgi:hypothetical protein
MRRKLAATGAVAVALAVVAAVFARDAVAPALATFPGAKGRSRSTNSWVVTGKSS